LAGKKIEEIAEALSNEGVTVKNKAQVVSALAELADNMTIAGETSEEEIATLEEAIGAPLTADQKAKIESRHEGALDVAADMKKPIVFSKTCVNHARRLVEAL